MRDLIHRISASILFFLLVAALACDRNTEPFVPGEEPRTPDLARIFPDTGQGPGAERGEAAAGAAPMGGGRRGAAPVSASGSISGRVSVAPELAEGSSSGSVLFVIARTGNTAGPPLAVLRMPAGELPTEFTIGPDQVMVPGMAFAGPISLTARLDADGNATSRQPGDLEGTLSEPVAPGTQDVELILDIRH